VLELKNCSLCEGELQPEGGAILFIDSRGIPFETCGTCQQKIELLRNAKDLEDTGRALKYISECAKTLENRDTYQSLMDYLRNMGREGLAEKEESNAGSQPQENLARENRHLVDI
jgi:hypothetical protein